MVKMTRGFSSREFLRLGGAGLAGGGGQQGGGEVVKFFTGTAQMASQEKAYIEKTP